eukprot:16084-Heterococcus_DN1.PRE.3
MSAKLIDALTASATIQHSSSPRPVLASLHYVHIRYCTPTAMCVHTQYIQATLAATLMLERTF